MQSYCFSFCKKRKNKAQTKVYHDLSKYGASETAIKIKFQFFIPISDSAFLKNVHIIKKGIQIK